ncbi:MAG: YifB family Mg chelatase-like AAA ATPase [Clostridiales bacterium]|nr:YifB family Mg chelatase-like AAA ATPase [Clostridiales bacterium]
MSTGALSQIRSVSICGIDTEIVTVETDLTVGLPSFSIVGLPGSAVRESKERVHAAIVNSGYEFPLRRITVNLSPADLRKEGSHLDLPIAVGILMASVRSKEGAAFCPDTAYIGELSLDGALKRLELAAAMALGLQDAGIARIFLPAANLEDVANLPGLLFFPAETLRDIVSHVTGEFPLEAVRGRDKGAGVGRPDVPPTEDFLEVKGQEAVKRALLIAVAGRHDILLTGPPGVGKSMLARRVPGILPLLSDAESREVTRIHGIARTAEGHRGLIRERPYRAPHHSATQTAMIGGGYRLAPGEVSLAHHGVLFLDELPEFNRHTLEMLRQPLEDRFVDLSRASLKGRYPCDFLLICAMNPCPCGYFGDPAHFCTCTETARQRYRAKISGPFLDRIDIHVRMGAVRAEDLAPAASCACMSSGEMRRLTEKVCAAQAARAKPDFCWNGRLDGARGSEVCRPAPEALRLLDAAYTRYALSVRARMKLLRVARTIADIEGSEQIFESHMAEAIAYRVPFDLTD